MVATLRVLCILLAGGCFFAGYMGSASNVDGWGWFLAMGAVCLVAATSNWDWK